MSWTIIKNDDNKAEFEEFSKALALAAEKRILMLGAASDEGYIHDNLPYPAKANGVICIGAAKDSGVAEEAARKDGDFFFPGANFESASGESKNRHGQMYISGSSFATALASGFTALLLYCVEVAVELGENPSTRDEDKRLFSRIKSKHRQQLQDHETLRKVFKGMCIHKGAGIYIPFFRSDFKLKDWRDNKHKREFFNVIEKILR